MVFTANKCLEGLPGPGLCRGNRPSAWPHAWGRRAVGRSTSATSISTALHAGWGSSRFTPPVQAIAALSAALDLFESEGREARLARYTANMRVLYDGVTRLGLRPVLPQAVQGPIVVNVRAPDHAAWSLQRFVDSLKARGFLISNFSDLDVPSFRVGCIGMITPPRHAQRRRSDRSCDGGKRHHAAAGGLMRSDIDIADATVLQPVAAVAAELGIPASALEPYGRYKAKIGFDFIRESAVRPDGALVLVTGINPTPAGEGKTTTTIGLGDALRRSGKRVAICLREPSLGPCFGTKGGATGGGLSQVAPMAEINLHFTGDFHAVTSANNLLAAMLDNHLYWGNELGIDARRVSWHRSLDMNDRALRDLVHGLGSPANGAPRQDAFDITVASEVMAVFCLASDLADLEARLGRIVVAPGRDGPVTARDLKADGAMAALLRDALQPNLVQSLEGTPALVHGGPFANIAHGCNSVIATRLGLKLADIVVTEAGFGADLGAEKFLDIKCRSAGLRPGCCVVVATVRALKMHGGVTRTELAREDVDALRRGLPNLQRHVANMAKFGLPVVVAVNRFDGDTQPEYDAIREALGGVELAVCSNWANGSLGSQALADAVLRVLGSGQADYRPLYPSSLGLAGKLRVVAQEIYGAADIDLPPKTAARLASLEAAGHAHLPVCIAKTQYSFSAYPNLLGAPVGHILPIREVKLFAGAGFVVALCGDILMMPGLPRHPAAERIGLDSNGRVRGLF